MTIEQNLKYLIVSKFGSMREFSKQIEMSQSTLATIMNRGIHNASISNIIKICHALGISTDELAQDRIVFVDASNQSRRMTEINDIVAYAKRNIQDYKDLTIDGQPATQDELERLLDGIDIALGIIKRNRDRKKKTLKD